jgi:hypothetical protein
MVVLACLQLGVYWFMTAMGIWIDQVVNDALSQCVRSFRVLPSQQVLTRPFRSIATHNVVYKFQSITTVVTFLPWIVLGWWALTRENKIGLAVFLGWAVALIVAWAIDFYSLGMPRQTLHVHSSLTTSPQPSASPSCSGRSLGAARWLCASRTVLTQYAQLPHHLELRRPRAYRRLHAHLLLPLRPRLRTLLWVRLALCACAR